MEWDLGFRGLGLLLLMSLAFGAATQLMLRNSTPHWLWLVGTFTFFFGGLFISEVWFGWATEEELQPNVDGLSFDETLLALIPGLFVVLGIRWMSLRQRRRGRIAPSV